MRSDGAREWLLNILSVLVLLAFAWMFGRALCGEFAAPELSAFGEGSTDAGADIEKPRLYIMTTFATLVGGVSAVFLGAEGGRAAMRDSARSAAEWIRLAYVLVYAAFGLLAIVAWSQNEARTALEVRNLAVTFLGLIVPAIGAYLGARLLMLESGRASGRA